MSHVIADPTSPARPKRASYSFGPSETPKARTARLAGAEWGFRGPREAPAAGFGAAGPD